VALPSATPVSVAASSSAVPPWNLWNGQDRKRGVILRAGEYLGVADGRWELGGVTVTSTRYAPLRRQSRHRHENPTYFFLIGGEFCDVSSELGSRYPQRFELLFHPAGAWHEGVSGESGRFGLNIEPSVEWLAGFGLEAADLGEYRVDSDPVRGCELLRLANAGMPGEWAADQILEILLPLEPVATEGPDWLKRLDSLLFASDEVRWGLRSLAHELGVHPVYLARVFRQRYRCSVTQWLLRRRLLEAARGLLKGRAASGVAHQAGFADQSHFGRAFRSYLELTPGHFQRRWAEWVAR